mmetsp:Transcript_31613/g.106471  ORF Transcript_31613/g.106471 Transcript_31613/m.106471 type:complete len:104 (+) Transcript_31613:532-843(+)
MSKLLAALSLPTIDSIDLAAEEAQFTLRLGDRVYTLRAPTQADAEQWMTTLLQLKATGARESERRSVTFGEPAAAVAIASPRPQPPPAPRVPAWKMCLACSSD